MTEKNFILNANINSHYVLTCDTCFKKMYPAGAEEISLGLAREGPCYFCGTQVGLQDSAVESGGKFHYVLVQLR